MRKTARNTTAKGYSPSTQLSCTFRPRRRPRRLRDKREKYHHSLKALAIRERKIHIIGSPELKIEGTPVYLDVEGLPDRDFYYLIGMRIGTGESAVQHSLWADSLQDEKHIWNAFLSILERIANPVLIHYGSYEKTFLKQMILRHGQPKEEPVRDNIIGSSVNVLSVTFAQIYFPAFTNGLKDTAHCLGSNWTDARAGGLQAIAWRYLWEQSRAAELKERLIRYNTQDCQALSLVANLISKYTGPQENGAANENGRAEVVHADADKFLKRSNWRTFASPVSGFEYINSAAHWCYQRDRVYARTGAAKRQLPTHKRRVQMSRRVEKEVRWEVSHFCPVCKRRVWKKGPLRTRTLQDILFGRNSLKLRIVRFVFQTYHCPKCRNCFGMPARFQLCRKYGWNFLAYFFYHIVELAMPQRAVAKSFNRLFGFHLNCSTLNNLKIKAADYYTETKQQILELIIRGPLVHADETRANIKGRSAFVWVLASMSEVFYILSDSREGEIAQKLLTEFKGVLVSDFYTAYDSIGCPQQRCLIHLMRDLNDEILNNPFDDRLKAIVTGFGDLLKPIVETVDRFGLKSHFLKKHLVCVERFYRRMERAECSSDAALK